MRPIYFFSSLFIAISLLISEELDFQKIEVVGIIIMALPFLWLIKRETSSWKNVRRNVAIFGVMMLTWIIFIIVLAVEMLQHEVKFIRVFGGSIIFAMILTLLGIFAFQINREPIIRFQHHIRMRMLKYIQIGLVLLFICGGLTFVDYIFASIVGFLAAISFLSAILADIDILKIITRYVPRITVSFLIPAVVILIRLFKRKVNIFIEEPIFFNSVWWLAWGLYAVYIFWCNVLLKKIKKSATKTFVLIMLGGGSYLIWNWLNLESALKIGFPFFGYCFFAVLLTIDTLVKHKRNLKKRKIR